MLQPNIVTDISGLSGRQPSTAATGTVYEAINGQGDSRFLVFDGESWLPVNAFLYTLTNPLKRRVVQYTDAATITPNVANTDVAVVLTLSQATTLANPLGTPIAAQILTVRIKSSSAQTLTHGTKYRGSVASALPTATSGGGLTDYFSYIYHEVDDKWDYIPGMTGF